MARVYHSQRMREMRKALAAEELGPLLDSESQSVDKVASTPDGRTRYRIDRGTTTTTTTAARGRGSYTEANYHEDSEHADLHSRAARVHARGGIPASGLKSHRSKGPSGVLTDTKGSPAAAATTPGHGLNHEDHEEMAALEDGERTLMDEVEAILEATEGDEENMTDGQMLRVREVQADENVRAERQFLADTLRAAMGTMPPTHLRPATQGGAQVAGGGGGGQGQGGSSVLPSRRMSMMGASTSAGSEAGVNGVAVAEELEEKLSLLSKKTGGGKGQKKKKKKNDDDDDDDDDLAGARRGRSGPPSCRGGKGSKKALGTSRGGTAGGARGEQVVEDPKAASGAFLGMIPLLSRLFVGPGGSGAPRGGIQGLPPLQEENQQRMAVAGLPPPGPRHTYNVSQLGPLPRPCGCPHGFMSPLDPKWAAHCAANCPLHEDQAEWERVMKHALGAKGLPIDAWIRDAAADAV